MPGGPNLQSGGKALCILSCCERGLLVIQYNRLAKGLHVTVDWAKNKYVVRAFYRKAEYGEIWIFLF